MNYSKFLTERSSIEDIERVEWSDFVDKEYIYEFNYIATPTQVFATTLKDIEVAVEAILTGGDPERYSRIARDKSILWDGTYNEISYPSKNLVIEKDMEGLNLPSYHEGWSISFNDLKNHAVATKELDSGLICVNIAMFGHLI